MTRSLSCLYLIVFGAFLVSCSEAPSERAAKHERRGDGYVQQSEFREAVIEYKNRRCRSPSIA